MRRRPIDVVLNLVIQIEVNASPPEQRKDATQQPTHYGSTLVRKRFTMADARVQFSRSASN